MTGGAGRRRNHIPAHPPLGAGQEALAENHSRTSLTFDLRIAVEQAIARGETVDAICDRLRVAVATVDAVLARMTELATQPDVDVEPCGTHAAYNRHRANGESADDDCRAAESAYQAERHRARRRQRAVA